jgi:hypothetical protein
MDRLFLIQGLLPMIAVIVAVAITGWVITTWLRIKHGYPLDGAWGQTVYPRSSAPSSARSRTGSPMSSGSSPTAPTASTARSSSCAARPTRRPRR